MFSIVNKKISLIEIFSFNLVLLFKSIKSNNEIININTPQQKKIFFVSFNKK